MGRGKKKAKTNKKAKAIEKKVTKAKKAQKKNMKKAKKSAKKSAKKAKKAAEKAKKKIAKATKKAKKAVKKKAKKAGRPAIRMHPRSIAGRKAEKRRAYLEGHAHGTAVKNAWRRGYHHGRRGLKKYH